MTSTRRDMVEVLLLDEGEEDPAAAPQRQDARRPRPQPLTIGFSVALLAVALVTVSLLRSSPEPDSGPPVTAPRVPPFGDVVPALPQVDGTDVRPLAIPGTVEGELAREVRTAPGEQHGVAGAMAAPDAAYVVRVACQSPSGRSLTYGISPNGQDVLTSGTVTCDGQEVVNTVGDVPAMVPLVVTFGAAGPVDDIGAAYAVVVPAP